MIAVDTSSVVAYLAGATGKDVLLVETALAERQVCFPPVVLSELLSDPKLERQVAAVLKAIPFLPIQEGYWERTGVLRARVLARRRRARLADALITQSCIDHAVPLVSRDTDFRYFAEVSKLRLIS